MADFTSDFLAIAGALSEVKPIKPRPESPASERRATTSALLGLARQRAEMDRRWDADRARYGMSMPQYVSPASFPTGKWELWCREHPGAINVVAWREQHGQAEPPERIEPEVSEADPAAQARQLAWF